MELTNQSSIVEAPTITKKMSTAKKATIALIAISLALLISQGVMAAAPTSGDFLYGVYNEVVGWLTGAPGIIISIFTFGFAAFQGIMKQNYATCVGAFLIALLFANAQDAVEYFLTASVGVL